MPTLECIEKRKGHQPRSKEPFKMLDAQYIFDE